MRKEKNITMSGKSTESLDFCFKDSASADCCPPSPKSPTAQSESSYKKEWGSINSPEYSIDLRLKEICDKAKIRALNRKYAQLIEEETALLEALKMSRLMEVELMAEISAIAQVKEINSKSEQ